jgi:hypothetical protein
MTYTLDWRTNEKPTKRGTSHASHPDELRRDIQAAVPGLVLAAIEELLRGWWRVRYESRSDPVCRTGSLGVWLAMSIVPPSDGGSGEVDPLVHAIAHAQPVHCELLHSRAISMVSRSC